MAQSTLVKSGVVHSGSVQCILVKSDELRIHLTLYLSHKSRLCCCSVTALAPQQLRRNYNGILPESVKQKDFGGSIIYGGGPSPIEQSPFPIKTIQNIDSFKHLLETYLFSQKFC